MLLTPIEIEMVEQERERKRLICRAGCGGQRGSMVGPKGAKGPKGAQGLNGPQGPLFSNSREATYLQNEVHVNEPKPLLPEPKSYKLTIDGAIVLFIVFALSYTIGAIYGST